MRSLSLKKREKEEHLNFQVKFSGIIPEIADLIKTGDIAKNMEGRMIGQVKSIISNKPVEFRALSSKDNEYVTISNSFQKDIVAILDLTCEEKNGVLYFKDYPIKVGSMLIFATDLYSVNGTITGLENK